MVFEVFASRRHRDYSEKKILLYASVDFFVFCFCRGKKNKKNVYVTAGNKFGTMHCTDACVCVYNGFSTTTVIILRKHTSYNITITTERVAQDPVLSKNIKTRGNARIHDGRR